jgi:hypothetical protein
LYIIIIILIIFNIINIIIICILHCFVINPLEKLSFLYNNNNNIYRPQKINKGNIIFNNLGMPSSHSEIIVIICILLYIKYNFNIIFLILLVLLIGLQRIISKKHTLFQVIIGYLFGLFYGFLYIKNPYYIFIIIPILILLVLIEFENNHYNIPDYIDPELLPIIKNKIKCNICNTIKYCIDYLKKLINIIKNKIALLLYYNKLF